jgi:hypothetical protein
VKGGEDGSNKDCGMVSIHSASDDEVDAKEFMREVERRAVTKS